MKRQCDRTLGAARTLIASYKTPHSLFTEFVGDERETLAMKADPARGTKLSQPPRFFTPRECARLQGFPERFVLTYKGQRNPNRLYHQIGNAVSPATVTLLGQAIVDTGVFE